MSKYLLLLHVHMLTCLRQGFVYEQPTKGGKSVTSTGWVKAIYRDGRLQLLEPIDLPEGAEVWVELQVGPQPVAEATRRWESVERGPVYPTRDQPPETLARLIGLVAVGGDALADSEALYDADCH
jgi:predicted DNA-binding antitoxin AbrB/MazE fold protein